MAHAERKHKTRQRNPPRSSMPRTACARAVRNPRVPPVLFLALLFSSVKIAGLLDPALLEEVIDLLLPEALDIDRHCAMRRFGVPIFW